ncbi:hypothetical protein GEMRC1_005156 [Eukaryota sp. GEM-RC1]
MSGYIELASGSSFSGKTSWLLSRLHTLHSDKKKYELLSYDLDSVHLKKSLLQSHNGDEFMATTCSSLDSVYDKIKNADIVAIDNAHFFSNVAPFAEKLANSGIHVIITALNSSFDLSPFKNILELIPLVDHFIHLSGGACQCGSPSNFSKLLPGVVTPPGQIHPNPKAFEACCKKCHPNGGSGNLRLFIGPMFAGKTTSMIQNCRKSKALGKSVLILKYCNDVRYSCDNHTLYTHDGDSVTAMAIQCLSEAESTIRSMKPDVVGVDEGQFYSDLNLVKEWSRSGIEVIVAGLSGTFARKSFGSMMELTGVADEVYLLKSKCACGSEAPFSKRLVRSDALELIGGAESYSPVCRACFFG